MPEAGARRFICGRIRSDPREFLLVLTHGAGGTSLSRVVSAGGGAIVWRGAAGR